MREIRVFVEEPLANLAEIELPRPAAVHLLRVLRLGAGASVTLFDGRGGAYRATLTQTGRGGTRARIDGFDPVERESPLAITLLQAVSRAEKMDWVLQKATELGVAAIQPVLAERSVMRLEADRAGRRRAHWLGVLRSACEQCGRNRVPALLTPASLEAACATFRAGTPGAPGLLLDPDAKQTLRGALGSRPAAAALLIGPEGGWSEREIDVTRRLGFEATRFGPRVLRTETAAIAALAALQAWAGDFAED
jgi:16S rRNA (uracil1498-N3)-methyltransferase